MKKQNISQEQLSFIRRFITEAFDISDFEAERDFVIKKVEESFIFEDSKKKMLFNLKYTINNRDRLNQYLVNSLLYFEGMGVK